MKKILSILVVSLLGITAEAQSIRGNKRFVSTTNQTVSVNDTVKIGFPMAGQQSYSFIENKNDKTIKKTGKVAASVGKASSLFGLGGLRGAVTALRLSQAANSAQVVSGTADLANGNGIIKPEQKLVITKFYQENDKEFYADAVNQNKIAFKIKINQALLLKEVVPNGVSIYSSEEK